MAYVPIGMPIDSSVDTTGVEATPETPFMVGMGIDFEDTLSNTMSGVGIYSIRKWYTNHYNPGEFLTGDEIKEKYPNISMPEGGYENVIKLKSERKAAHDFADEVVGNMKPGFFKTAGRLGQFLIGNATDPVQGLLGHGINSLIAKPLGYAATKIPIWMGISESITRTGLGVVEGMTHALPYVGLQTYEGKEIQEPSTITSALMTFGLGGTLGGLYRTVAGFKKIIPNKTPNNIINTAANQIKSGKTVDVDLLVKDALYKSFKEETALKEGELSWKSNFLKRNSMLEEDLNVIQDQIKEEERKVSTLKKTSLEKKEGKLFKLAQTFEKFTSFLKKIPEGEKDGVFIFDEKTYSRKELKNIFEKAYETVKYLNKLKTVEKDINLVMANTMDYISLIESNKGSVTPLELSDKIKNINSWKGNDITYINDMNKADKIIASEETNLEQEINDHENYFKNLKDSDKLNEAEKESLWNIEKEDEMPSLLDKALKETIQCLTGIE